MQSIILGGANSALQVGKPLVRGNLLYLLASHNLYDLVAGACLQYRLDKDLCNLQTATTCLDIAAPCLMVQGAQQL